MASFTDLPIELHRQILEDTLPIGFESLALTCRYFYSLSQGPLAERHAKDKARFTSLKMLINWNMLDTDFHFTSEGVPLLDNDELDGNARAYCRQLSLAVGDACQYGSILDRSSRGDREADMPGFVDYVSLLTGLDDRFYQERSLFGYWDPTVQCLAYEEWKILILGTLTTLFPNVEHIEYDCRTRHVLGYKRCDKVDPQALQCLTPYLSVQQLRKLTIWPSDQQGIEPNGTSLDKFMWTLHLPALEQLTLGGLQQGNGGGGNHAVCGQKAWALRKLHLHFFSSTTKKELLNFFTWIPRLNTCSWSYDSADLLGRSAITPGESLDIWMQSSMYELRRHLPNLAHTRMKFSGQNAMVSSNWPGAAGDTAGLADEETISHFDGTAFPCSTDILTFD